MYSMKSYIFTVSICVASRTLLDQMSYKSQLGILFDFFLIFGELSWKVVIYGCELDHKEGWALKNWCFCIVVPEKTLESPFDSKEIKAVSPKGNQPWIFIGRTDGKTEASVLWPPDAKSQLHCKRHCCMERLGAGGEGVTEDEMVGWHHWLNRHEFEQTQGDGKGQRSLACCSPWDRRVRHDLVTEQQWQFPVNISPSPLSFWIRGCGSFLWFRFLPHPSSPGFLLCIHLALIGLVTWIPSRLTAGDVVWQFTANISYVWCETLCTKASPVFLLAKKKRASPESYYRPRYSALSTEVSFQTEWNGYNKWRQKQIVAERKRCLSKSRGGASRAWRGSCVCAERVSAENFGQT